MWVRKLIIDHGVSVLALQETRTSNVGVKDIRKFWGNTDLEMAAVDSQGRSGGLVTVWDPKVFNMCKTEENQNFLLVSGYLKDVEMPIIF